MPKIIECSQSDVSQKNTGAKEQCLVAPVVRHALAPTSQEFATATAAKTLADWRTAEAAKEIIMLFELEALANANIEPTFFEGRRKYLTKEGKSAVTFEVHLGACSYGALKSYDGKKMRVYEFTDDQKIIGTTPDGTKVRGQLITIEVGPQNKATDDKPQFCVVTITYEDSKEYINGPVELKPSWSHLELQGIFDIDLELVSASATEIKFKASAGCSGDDVIKAFEDADILLKDGSGAPATHSFVAADADGVYTLTGTGFATGFTVELNGVVQKTEATYEDTGALVITV
jgi:hypothetical protein